MERRFSVSSRKSASRSRNIRRRPGCIRLFVCPTTGGRLEISVSPKETILGLKAALARKLRINPSRITLLFKEKVLSSGRLLDYQIPEDSQLTLLPNMESGLSLQHSEKSITQALENLTESQVNDFLSGRAPLMLAIRTGEHMVFVQLQLSTQQVQGCAQQKPCMTHVTPATAALLSQGGLSASALAQATRCISRKIHSLKRMNQPQVPELKPVAYSPDSSPKLPSDPVSQPPPMTLSPPPHPAAANPTVSSASTSAVMSPTTPMPSLLQLPMNSPLPNSSQMASPPPSPGAVIDSIKHMGKGIFRGTFSGTLDSTLQDANGQPKRSVRTILHILNDLLVAAPNSAVAGQGDLANPLPSNLKHPAVPQAPILTPPASPKLPESPVKTYPENPENTLLRGKMQRIQTMLAQRKEQRRKRRQVCFPYSHCKSSKNQTVSSATSALSASFASTKHATATPSACCSQLCTQLEESKECSSNYCNASLEQDPLAV